MKKYTVEKRNEFTVYHNENGADISVYRAEVIEADGYVFKDLAGCGKLLPYEDWRLPAGERAADLAARLSVEEIAGLMLYSSHQMVPFYTGMPFTGHYGGKAFEEADVPEWSLCDEQRSFLKEDHLRHVLLMAVKDAGTSARWSNELQKTAEGEKWGIPVDISSDPRHGAGTASAEYKSTGLKISGWPEGIGMAAAGEEYWRDYARAVKREYRALGITTALGPQIDLATEPRWMRMEDTFGGDLETCIRMTQVICGELQTTPGSDSGWGSESVAAMAKHWPGGGTGEGGRDAHYGYGKYAVYPGGNFDSHRKVFTEGALKLDGPTGQTASIMPYYTVSWEQDKKNGENVGNSYSSYLIRDLLRGEAGYDGVICTDWGITGDMAGDIDGFEQRCYGMEHLTPAERHLRLLMNGIDQFGGNNDKRPVLEAFETGTERYGREVMEKRFRESAGRLLTNMFRLGLFEDPYLDPEKSSRIVGSRDLCERGMEAQKASLVLLKNRNRVLPLKKGIRVYVPERHLKGCKNFFRVMEEGRTVIPLAKETGDAYFVWAKTPEEADAAIVFAESPCSECHSKEDLEAGGNGYLPISLQYRPYTADAARLYSIAGGDIREADADRSYRGKTSRVSNESDLDNILDTKRRMGDRPVIVVLRLHNPAVVSEFEKEADAIIADFGVSARAILEVIFGGYAPKGRLPVIMPADMETVELHCEDVFDDIRPYVDEEGSIYTAGFGLRY